MADSTPYTFDKKGVDRIVRAVRAVEAGQVATPGAKRPPADYNVIVANITGDDHDQEGADPDHPKYEWEQVRLTGDNADTQAAGLSGTLDDDTYAVAPGGGKYDAGDLVMMIRMAVNNGDGTFDLRWAIVGKGSKGTLRYQVFQMVTDNQTGFDWARFH